MQDFYRWMNRLRERAIGRIVARGLHMSASLAVVGLLTAVVLVSCSPLGPDRGQDEGVPSQSLPSSPEELPAATAAFDANNLPLDFAIVLYGDEGRETRLGEVFAEGKPVVINFWAGQCPSCRVELPHFQEIHEAHGEQLLILGLDVGAFTGLGTQEDARALIEEFGITYMTGALSQIEAMKTYRVTGMPTTLFMAADGTIVDRWTGLLSGKQLTEKAESLLSGAT